MVQNMTQSEKDLLVKDLSARLPYSVKVKFNYIFTSPAILKGINKDSIECDIAVCELEDVKPYLFPLSSMTAEQLYELREMFGFEIEFDNIGIEFNGCLSYLEMDALFEWLDRHHFDCRDLIPMGLALDASNLNIY